MHPATALPTGIDLDPLSGGDLLRTPRDPSADLAWLRAWEADHALQMLPSLASHIDRSRGEDVRQTQKFRYWILKAEQEKYLRLLAERERDQWRAAGERLGRAASWLSGAITPVVQPVPIATITPETLS